MRALISVLRHLATAVGLTQAEGQVEIERHYMNFYDMKSKGWYKLRIIDR
jgi:hypothetical protein